jgi:hypothetical protein
MKIKLSISKLFVLVAAAFAAGVHADINVGVTLSATGPAASLGIPEKNTVALLPRPLPVRRSITSSSMMLPIPPRRSRTPAS